MSSVFLFSGVLYLWSFLSAVPLNKELLGPLPRPVFWIVGSLLGLVTAVCAFREAMRPRAIVATTPLGSAWPQSPTARYTIAALSFAFYFAGVLWLIWWYAPLAFPLLRQVSDFLLFVVACLAALTTAIYSFRATVKSATEEGPELPRGTSAELHRQPVMSMSRVILLISVLYLAAKITLSLFCYFSRESLLNVHPSTLIPIGMVSAWFLPLIVVIGTVIWQWNAPGFRWLSVIVFVVWMAGLAFAETILWAYFLFGPTGEISPI